ncbi:unnamed protein product [Acanthosepion pharaonis]|uniref:Transmembrane protein n=1 Tax=Acanthosepion pharaonis TaxID=158019 RepID=A0A812C6Y3_ACAPH|nr:unnamed protein product [Sepia pharaonis]
MTAAPLKKKTANEPRQKATISDAFCFNVCMCVLSLQVSSFQVKPADWQLDWLPFSFSLSRFRSSFFLSLLLFLRFNLFFSLFTPLSFLVVGSVLFSFKHSPSFSRLLFLSHSLLRSLPVTRSFTPSLSPFQTLSLSYTLPFTLLLPPFHSYSLFHALSLSLSRSFTLSFSISFSHPLCLPDPLSFTFTIPTYVHICDKIFRIHTLLCASVSLSLSHFMLECFIREIVVI